MAFNKSSLGVGGRFKREGIYVCLWLIHVAVQKPAQHCKEIIIQLKIFLKITTSKWKAMRERESDSHYGFLSLIFSQKKYFDIIAILPQFYSNQLIL